MTVAQHLHLRAFLEGVEVPVIAATIQSQKNAPATCILQIPANDYALDLLPRTLVHVFFKDLYNSAPPEEMVSVAGPGIRVGQRDEGIDPELEGLFPPERFQSTPDQDLTDLENDNYKLCFGGEVLGVQFSKAPGNRSIVLQCLDWSSYWDIAYQYQVSGMSLGGGGIRAAFTGASTSLFNSFLDGSADIITNIMSTPPRSYPRLRGSLLGALVHVIEAIGGTYFGRRAVRGTNDFFSLAEMRLHLTQMVGANPFRQNDEIRLLRSRGFGSLFRRSLSGLGKLVSIRQVLLALQKYIFHEHVPITTPRFIPALTDPSLPNYETVSIRQDEETRPLARVANQVKSRANEMQQRQARSTDSESARRQSDRRSGLQPEIQRIVRILNRAASQARQVGLQGGGNTRLADFYAIPDVSRAFTAAANKFVRILDATRRGQRPGVRTHTFYAPGTRSEVLVTKLLTEIAEDMQRVLNSRHRRRVQRTSSQPYPPPRLLTNIYRPDVWMVAPPRCNVIFPELYSSFTYGRDFNREVTRLLLRTHSALFGSDILFDGFYMSPSRLHGQRTNRSIGKGKVGKNPDHTDAPAWVVRDLMEHELFTGIIPTFERMSDLNLHAIRGGELRLSNGARIGYAQLAANHIFFQYRFKSRQLQLSGKFNPYLALGFPCVVIDKYMAVDQLRDGDYDNAIAAGLATAIAEGEGDFDLGGPPSEERAQVREANIARVREVLGDVLTKRPNTHYLGTPASLMHTLTAMQGGTTQLQMGYARTNNERTEFLGDNVAQTPRARRVRNQSVPSVVAALEPPSIGSRGPRGGRITEVVDVTSRYRRNLPRSTRGAQLRRSLLQRDTREATLARLQAAGVHNASDIVRDAAKAGAFNEETASNQNRVREHLSSTRLPLYVGSRRYSGRRRRGTRVRVGITQPAKDYGPEVVALVGTAGRVQTSTEDAREVLVTFSAYRIEEEVGVYNREYEDVPPEELTFPPWYGEHYRSNNIGGLYSYFFGTGSITDPLSVITGRAPSSDQVHNEFDGGTIGGMAPAQERSVRIAFQQRFSKVAEAAATSESVLSSDDQRPTPGFSSKPEGIIGPPGEPDPEDNQGRTLAEVEARSPINVALEEVVRAYSQVKLNHYDVHQFIRAYTWRPIATMVDMFGTANLEISDDGEVLRGREGFHSRAFGEYDDLRQLVGQGEGNRPQRILGLDTRDQDERDDSDSPTRDERIAARMDTRKEKRTQVLKYLQNLLSSRGILG